MTRAYECEACGAVVDRRSAHQAATCRPELRPSARWRVDRLQARTRRLRAALDDHAATAAERTDR